jgi:type I restriction enzyme, S subunit
MTDTIVNSFDIWTDAQGLKAKGRVKSIENISLEGTTSLRNLILDLAIQGKLTTRYPNDEPASKLLTRIIEEKNKLISNRTQVTELKVAANEKPFQLPNEWIWSKLGSLGIAQTGSTPKTTIPEYFNGGKIPFIGPGQINRDGRIMESDKFLTEKGSEYSSIAEHGDIVMVCIGGSIGKSAIVQSKITFNQQLNSIRPLLVQSNYLQLALNSTLFQNSILKKSTGSATPIINRSKWESIAIPLPPIAEQHRIVTKVDELMALCDKLEAEQFSNLKTHQVLVKTLLETLTQAADANELKAAWERMSAHFDTLFCTEDSIEQLKQTILQLAVMGKLVRQDPNDEPASELLKKIAKEKERLVEEGNIKRQTIFPEINDNEKRFVLPRSWEWCRLQNLITLLGDGIHGTPEYEENGEYYFVNGNNLSNGIIEIKSNTKTVTEKEYQLHKRDLNERTILVSINGTIGNTAFYNNERIILGKSACYFNLLNKIEKEYIRLIITSKYFIDYAFSEATGTTIQNVSLRTMRSLVIPLPPFNEQQKIIQKVQELFSICDKLSLEIIESQNIKVQLSKTIVEKSVQ